MTSPCSPPASVSSSSRALQLLAFERCAGMGSLERPCTASQKQRWGGSQSLYGRFRTRLYARIPAAQSN
ncbi:hypothetical protein VTO73DRAFT_13866 [Trametes versicolor]